MLNIDHGKGVAFVHHPLRAVGEIHGQRVEQHGVEGEVFFFRGLCWCGDGDEDGEEEAKEFHAGGSFDGSGKKSMRGLRAAAEISLCFPQKLSMMPLETT